MNVSPSHTGGTAVPGRHQPDQATADAPAPRGPAIARPLSVRSMHFDLLIPDLAIPRRTREP